MYVRQLIVYCLIPKNPSIFQAMGSGRTETAARRQGLPVGRPRAGLRGGQEPGAGWHQLHEDGRQQCRH